MRISDWSSDVCSSDLSHFPGFGSPYDRTKDQREQHSLIACAGGRRRERQGVAGAAEQSGGRFLHAFVDQLGGYGGALLAGLSEHSHVVEYGVLDLYPLAQAAELDADRADRPAPGTGRHALTDKGRSE